MRPLLPVAISFMIGIIAGERFGLSVAILTGFFFISLLPLLLFFLFGSFRRFSPLVTSLPFLFLGALFILPVIDPVLDQSHIVESLREKSGAQTRMSPGKAPMAADFEAVVKRRPQFDRGRSIVVVEALRLKKQGNWHPVTGLVRLNVRGRIEGVRRGDRVRVNGLLKEPYSFSNPGGYDYSRRLAADSIHVTGSVSHPDLFVKVAEGRSRPLDSIDSVRVGLSTFIDTHGFSNPAVMKALVTGDRSGLTYDMKEAFAGTGTSHLLAISGLHIGTVAFLSYGLLLFLLKRSEYLMLQFNIRKTAALGSVVPAIAYALVAGFPVSTTRALIMLGAYVFAFVLGRGRQYTNVLSLAALVILVIEPFALFEISFQLSFSAVAGIIFIAPRLNRFVLRDKSKDQASGIAGLIEKRGIVRRTALRLGRWAVTALIVSGSATIGTLPLVALHFNRLSTVTLLTNLFGVAITGIAVPFLLVGSLVSWLSGTLAVLILSVADMIIGLLLYTIELFAGVPWSSIHTVTPSWPEIILFYLLVVSVTCFNRGRTYRYAAVIVVLCLVASFVYPQVARQYAKELRVTFISVGQGDSTLLELPGGEVMLIDGGGFYYTDFDPGEAVVAPLLWKKKIKRIDYMVLSHAQHDHMGGLKFIAENFDVGQFWWNGIGDASKLIEILKGNGAEVLVLSVPSATDGAGATVGRTEAGAVSFEVLSPVVKGPAGGQARLNDRSLVLRAVYNKISFLFTGDIEAWGEAGIVARSEYLNPASTVLKAPHHASSTSSSPAFISAVSPELVVVSSGQYNPFGFPHRVALNEYARVGAALYRTDMDGAVEVSTDGYGLKTRTYAP